MFSRPPTSAAGLLSPHIPRNCTRCSLPLPLRQRNVFARFETTDSDPYDPASSAPRFNRKPKRRPRPRFKKDEHKRIPIGVTALGEPGEVVVVSNPRRRRPLPKSSQTPSETRDKNALPFMLNELEDNEDILDSSAVNECIESFCAQYSPRAKIPATDYDNLRTNLQLSFTTRQLSDYVLQFAEGETPLAESQIKHGNLDSVEWRPGTSSFFETSLRQGGIADRVAPSQSLTGKQLIAERILRDCWHLGIIDELGQVDVRLPLHSLTLLLYSKHFSFEELASLYDAKIDVTNSLGLVRITGRQNACESIRDIVYDAVTRIRVEELILPSAPAVQSKESGRIFTADFLSWISKTYGVAFEEASGCPSQIFYLAENKQDADDARRTLNLATYEVSPPPIPFGTYLSSSEPVAVSSVDPENNVSWFDRQKAWFRWAVPSAQTGITRARDTPFFDKHQTRLSDELLKLLRATSPAVNESSNAQVHESVTAAVGRCLFLQKPTFQNADITASQLGKMSLPRTFLTDIPRVASFLRTLTPHLPEEPQRPHRIRLVPSALHAGVFPPIDLEFIVQRAHDDSGSGADILVRSAKALLSVGNVDYLLPESGLDLRFSRKLTRDVSESFTKSPSSEIVHNTLRDLIFRSSSSDSETPLPAFTQLTLSNDVLSQPDKLADPSGSSTGEYMFMPVNDIRGTRVHQYDFKGQQLSYEFYESGPSNPYRTTELQLDMDLTDRAETGDNLSTPAEGESSDEAVQREFNSFYSAACSLSFELDKVWRMM